MASQEGYEDIVRLLVRAGARMDSCIEDGWCPLHMAAQGNRGEVVRTLVGLGCDRDMVSSAGVLLGGGGDDEYTDIHVVFFIRNYLIRKSGSKSLKIKKKFKKLASLK